MIPGTATSRMEWIKRWHVTSYILKYCSIYDSKSYTTNGCSYDNIIQLNHSEINTQIYNLNLKKQNNDNDYIFFLALL